MGCIMETELMRIGISIPDILLGKFDEIIGERGYSSRSEGIRDAIRNYISYCESMDDIKGHHIGIVAVIYDHTKKGVSNALINIQHKYFHLIKSSMHADLNYDNSFEVTILDGEGEEIKKLVEAMTALKGVKVLKIMALTSNENPGHYKQKDNFMQNMHKNIS
jgi:CopG family transcriptional regulator, nickel-responsive regulator